MSKKKKTIIIIMGIIILIAVIIGVTLVYIKYENSVKVTKLKDGTIVNKSNNFKNNKTSNELTLSDIKYEYKDNETVISGKLTNNSDKEVEEKMIEVVLLDKQHNEIGIVYIYIDELSSKTSKNVTGSIDQNYIEAYDYYIRLNTGE